MNMLDPRTEALMTARAMIENDGADAIYLATSCAYEQKLNGNWIGEQRWQRILIALIDMLRIGPGPGEPIN